MTTIEQLQPEHFEQVAEWLARPEINQWLSGEWREHRATAAMIAITARNRRNRLYLVRHEAAPCGLVALAEIDVADRLAMIWYVLGDSRLEGHGITSEAVRQLAKIGFSELSLASIYAWIMEDNFGSRRVLERSGFQECGRLRRAARRGERQIDRIYFDRIG